VAAESVIVLVRLEDGEGGRGVTPRTILRRKRSPQGTPTLDLRPEEATMAKKKAKRTTHRSSTGTKLYAKRDAKGRFKDIQTYKRSHAADLRKKSKSEK
jgi:hypothetical protein